MKRILFALLAAAFLNAPSAFAAIQSVGNGNTSCPTIGSGTFATRPLSGVSTCSHYFATDLGTGADLVWNGTNWRPAAGSAVIAQSGVASTNLTGSVAETNLANANIPAGLVGANDHLLVNVFWKVNSGSTNTRTGIVRWATTSVTSGAANTMSSASATVSSTAGFWTSIQAYSANSTTTHSVVGLTNFGPAASGLQTVTVDATQATVLSINGLLANSADSIQVVSYSIVWYAQ